MSYESLQFFLPVWNRLELRFGVREGAAQYLEYLLAQGLNADEIVRAGEGLWAHAKYFPRPADFLRPRALLGWASIIWAAKMRPATVEDWDMMREAVPDRAWAAITMLGGLDAVRETKDLARLKERYLEAFEEVGIAAGEEHLIPAGS